LTRFAPKGAKLSFQENAARTRGTLTITDGALKATVLLFGQFVAQGFTLSADGAGGTAITYTKIQTPRDALAIPLLTDPFWRSALAARHVYEPFGTSRIG
jgi:hypothetical protein